MRNVCCCCCCCLRNKRRTDEQKRSDVVIRKRNELQFFTDGWSVTSLEYYLLQVETKCRCLVESRVIHIFLSWSSVKTRIGSYFESKPIQDMEDHFIQPPWRTGRAVCSRPHTHTQQVLQAGNELRVTATWERVLLYLTSAISVSFHCPDLS
jgi:hypothetical protein